MFVTSNKVGLPTKYTVKPVLRGHVGTKKKWSSKTGDLLKEVQFI